MILSELADTSWDVVAFSETKAIDADALLEGGHRLVCSRGETSHIGVALLIHSRLVHGIVHVESISGRVCFVDICIHGYIDRFIACYFPHVGYDAEDFHSCLDSLRDVVAAAQNRNIRCVVGSDFNSQLSCGWRGDALHEFLCEFGVFAANGSEIDNWTFRSTLGATRVLDYMFVGGRAEISQANATNDLDLGSDHGAVLALYAFLEAILCSACISPWQILIGVAFNRTLYEGCVVHL